MKSEFDQKELSLHWLVILKTQSNNKIIINKKTPNAKVFGVLKNLEYIFNVFLLGF